MTDRTTLLLGWTVIFGIALSVIGAYLHHVMAIVGAGLAVIGLEFTAVWGRLTHGARPSVKRG